MIVDNHVCLRCGACAGACPSDSIFLHGTFSIEFLPTCTECGLCAIVCPVGAISDSSDPGAAPSLPRTGPVQEART